MVVVVVMRRSVAVAVSVEGVGCWLSSFRRSSFLVLPSNVSHLFPILNPEVSPQFLLRFRIAATLAGFPRLPLLKIKRAKLS